MNAVQYKELYCYTLSCMAETRWYSVQFGLHPLLGQLLAGLVLININSRWLTGGLKASWSAEIRAGALALIFLRSGLELDWEVRTFIMHVQVHFHLAAALPKSCLRQRQTHPCMQVAAVCMQLCHAHSFADSFCDS